MKHIHRAAGRSECTGKRHPGVIPFLEEIIDAAVVIFTYIIIQLTFATIAGRFGEILQQSYTVRLLDMPGFNYVVTATGEYGNGLFEIYDQLRFLAVLLLVIIVIVAAIMRFMESAGYGVSKGSGGQLLVRCMMIAIIIAAFPFIWDMMSSTMEYGAAWILNPLYSFDYDNPCPDTWTDEEIITYYNESPYRKGLPAIFVHDAVQACRPDFKPHYLISQVADTATATPPEDVNILELIVLWVTTLTTNFFADMFFGLAQALILINLTILTLVVLVLTDMLTSVVIAALPLLLVLSLVPHFKKATDMFLKALPSLFLIPLISSIVIVVGAGYVASAPEISDGEIVGGFDTRLIYVWIASLGVVFFAVSVPLMMVPLLGNVVGQATQMITSAVQSGAMITAMAAKGGVQGAMGGGGIRGGFKGAMTGGIAAHGGGGGQDQDKDKDKGEDEDGEDEES